NQYWHLGARTTSPARVVWHILSRSSIVHVPSMEKLRPPPDAPPSVVEAPVPIDSNDFVDLAHLAIGVPYCSAVLTERFWARALQETAVAHEYGTSVYGDLEEIGPIIGVS